MREAIRRSSDAIKRQSVLIGERDPLPDEGGNPEVLRRNQEAISAHRRT
jgi:hypothetical protein